MNLSAPSATPNELGQVLYEMKGQTFSMIICAVGCAVSLLVGIWLLYSGLTAPDNKMVLRGAGAFLVSCIFGAFGYLSYKFSFRCYEQGVVSTSALSGEKKLLYRDVASLDFSVHKLERGGVDRGTACRFVFQPIARSGKPPIAFMTIEKGTIDAMLKLRTLLSDNIAAHFHARLLNGESVPWTDDIFFLPSGGLEYLAGSAEGNRNKRILQPEDVTKYELGSEALTIFVPGNNQPAITIPIASNNFYPGFQLFQIRFSRAG